MGPGRPRRRAVLVGGLGLALAACRGGGGGGDAPTSTGARGGTTEPAPAEPPATTDATTGPTAGEGAGGAGPEPSAPTSLRPTDFDGAGTCLRTPEAIEGPYYVDEDLRRRDITDGRPGRPVRLGLMVVDAACAPIEGAVVDVWHADAAGAYSGFGAAGPGTRFLRGAQVADANGIVELRTIYPGWYRGRTVHVHVKVHLEDRTALTTQLVFDDAVTDEVHAAAPYADRGPRDTRNDDDPVIGDYRADGTLLTVRQAGPDPLLALGIIGVDPSGAGTARPIL